MASDFAFYNCFSTDLYSGVHHLVGTGGVGGVHVLKIAASNTEPNLTHSGRADIGALANVGGYSDLTLTNVGTVANGVLTVTSVDPPLWTSTGGFGGSESRFLILYNDTAANDPLIGWWVEPLSHMNTAGSTWQLSWDGGVVFVSGPRGLTP